MKTLFFFFALIVMTQAANAVTPSLTGDFAPAAVTSKDVVSVTKFAIIAERETLAKEKPETKLELVQILSAESQVVAGMNYRLQLLVKLDGVEKKAEAIVWWQSWREPDPFRMTEWTWK